MASELDTSKFKKGDCIKIVIREEHMEEVIMDGWDSCQPPHPVWRYATGQRKGERVPCGDIVYIG